MYDEALAPLTEVVKHDRSSETATVLLRDLVNLGRVRRERGEWEEARAIGDEARTLAESTGSPVDRAYASNYVGHLFRAMGRPEEALEMFAEAAAVATEAHLPLRRNFNILAMASIQLEIGQTDESLAAYEEGVHLARRASRADNLAQALTLQADALMTTGRPDDAAPAYEEAVEILSRLAIDGSLSETLGHLANAYEASGRTNDASATWRRVKDVRVKMGDPSGALEAAEHEVRLFTGDTRDTEEALALKALLEAALDMADGLEDATAQARIRNSLAILAWRGGDLESAGSQYEAAAECLRGCDERDGLGAILNGWGAVLAELGHHTDARSVLQDALKANGLEEESAREADSMAALGASFRASADLTQAYDWYQQCLEKRRVAGDRAGEGWALYRLAELSTEADASSRAGEFAAEALTIAQEIEDTELETLCRQTDVRGPAHPA
jgi:tetratricopeptide (TPR) repeat protein